MNQNVNNKGGIKPAFIKYRMWSQYADDHRGVALLLSKNKLCMTIKKYFTESAFFGPVKYRSNHTFDIELNGDSLSDEQYMRKFIINKRNEIFFKKHIDYRDENEYRILIIDDKFEDIFIDFKKCFIGIILGDRFHEVYFPIVKGFMDKYKTKAWKLSFWNCRYNLCEI